MITGEPAGRIGTASRNLGRTVVVTANLIYVDDPRLRGWSAANTGGLVQGNAPAWASASAKYTGGSLTSGTAYSWAIASVSGTVESTASQFVSFTPTGAASASLVWSAVNPVTSWQFYNIYRVTGTAGTIPTTAFVTALTATSYIDGGT